MEGYQYLTVQQGTNSPVELASPLSPFSPPLTVEPTSLSAWDQVAQRAYIQVALCFPFQGDKATAEGHIKSSLERLGRQRRDFAGSLKADPQNGRVQLEKHSNDEISFEVVDYDVKFPYTFAQLKAKDFAPSAFVHPDFALDGELAPFRLVPVCQVRASFIEGGLILWVYLHHTFADGDGLRMLLECFSAQTRGTEVDHPKNTDFETADAETSFSSDSSSAVEDLIRNCPEYVKAPKPQAYSPAALGTPLAQMTTGRPTTSHVQKKGYMFIFRHDRLDQLQSLIEAIQPNHRLQRKRPSSYVTLAALTWAHLTKARVETDPEAVAAQDPSSPAKLTKCVRWRGRALVDNVREYFGVAVALPFTQMPLGDVLRPCNEFNAMVPLVRAIEETIGFVNDEFVAQRTAALRAVAAEDPRGVVLDFDVRNPRQLAFNTWRYLGADCEWGVPGLLAARPVAVRPVRGEISMGYALVMPAGKDSEVHELVITLPEKAMEALIQDHDYMRWVDRVVE